MAGRTAVFFCLGLILSKEADLMVREGGTHLLEVVFGRRPLFFSLTKLRFTIRT